MFYFLNIAEGTVTPIGPEKIPAPYTPDNSIVCIEVDRSSLTKEQEAAIVAKYRSLLFGSPNTEHVETRASKLEIMRDSRVGTYGVIALGLVLALKAFYGVRTGIATENLYRLAHQVAEWTGVPVRNVTKTPLVGGQWRRKDDGTFDLVIVDNKTAPNIPTAGKMEALA